MLKKNLISNFSKLYSYDYNIMIHNYILSKDYINLQKLYYYDLYYNKNNKKLLNNLNYFEKLYNNYKLFYPNLRNSIPSFDDKYNSIHKKYCYVTSSNGINKNFDRLIYERFIHHNILFNNLELQDIKFKKNIYDKDLYNKIYFNVYLEIKKSYIY